MTLLLKQCAAVILAIALANPIVVFVTEEDNAVTETVGQDSTAWVNGFPQYFQNDYPDQLYGSGTVQTSGSSITCLAMVASAMTGHAYTPDELAYYFGARGENNIRRLEIGSQMMELSFHRAENIDRMWAALKEGKYAIVMLSKKSVFSPWQHFLVLTGINEEGLVTVMDPNRDNYSAQWLKDGYANGFPRSSIRGGFGAAWIYDPGEMPEEPFIYSEPRLDPEHQNYPELTLTDQDRELIARLIWGEARGECLEGQQAVAEVVLNRMASPDFPNTVSGVIHAEGQFQSVEDGTIEEAEPWQAQYQSIDRALHGELVLEKNVFFFAKQALTENIFGTIGNHVFCY